MSEILDRAILRYRHYVVVVLALSSLEAPQRVKLLPSIQSASFQATPGLISQL